MPETLLNGGFGFLVFMVITIIITRIRLYAMHKIFPATPFVDSSPTIKGLRLHHYMYGVVVAIIGLIVMNQYIIAVGIGLFIDELPQLLRYGNRFYRKEYRSIRSLIGVPIILVIISVVMTLI